MPTNSKPEYITSRDLDSLVEALRPTALPQLVRSIDKHGHGFWGTLGHVQAVGTLDQYFRKHYKKEFAKTSPGRLLHALDVSFFIGIYLGSVITSLRAQGHKPVAAAQQGCNGAVGSRSQRKKDAGEAQIAV
jgi:hypothetical protein